MKAKVKDFVTMVLTVFLVVFRICFRTCLIWTVMAVGLITADELLKKGYKHGRRKKDRN